MTGRRKNLVLFSTTVSLILGLLLEKSDRDAVCKSLGSPACFAVASPGSAWSQWPSFFSVCTRCRERSSKSAEKHCYKLRFSLKVKATQSCPTLRPHGLYSPWNSPGQNTGVGSLSLLQGILPTQGWNPASPALQAYSLPAEPPGKPKNTGVGSLSLLQQILPTQGLNRGLLHCSQTLYQLSYQGIILHLFILYDNNSASYDFL